MDSKNKFWFSGIISFVISFGVLSLFCSIFSSSFSSTKKFLKALVICFVISLVVWGFTFFFHLILYLFLGKREFSFINVKDLGGEDMSPDHKKAYYPPVDKELLSKVPDGFMFGRYNNQYVRMPIRSDNIMHGLLIGPPGTGKSAGPLISTLVTNNMQKKPPFTVFALDIKPELAIKSTDIVHNPNVRTVCMSDMTGWGWDVYYSLNENSAYDEVLGVLDDIAQTLMVSHKPEDEFFVNSAKNIFKGLMFFAYYYFNYNFLDSIRWLLGEETHKRILEALNGATERPWEFKVKAFLATFSGKPDNAFASIVKVLNEGLGVFSDDTVKYNFGDNENKACPRDLDNRISIYVCLPEKDLDKYSILLRLIVSQTIKFFEGREENQSGGGSDGTILMIIDEFPRLGKMDNVRKALGTLRSRGVSIILAVQNLAQLEDIYGLPGTRDIMQNCRCNLILMTSDSETVKRYSEMAGEYWETMRSETSSGILNFNGSNSFTTSKQKMPILTAKDFSTLSKRKKIMIFFDGIYYQTDKLYYYKDKVLNDFSTRVKAINTGTNMDEFIKVEDDLADAPNVPKMKVSRAKSSMIKERDKVKTKRYKEKKDDFRII